MALPNWPTPDGWPMPWRSIITCDGALPRAGCWIWPRLLRLKRLLKYRPDQSRVPAGDPAGGQFADEGRGGGHDGGNSRHGATGHWQSPPRASTPLRVEDIDDHPLGHAYGVDAIIGGAAAYE